MFEWTGLFAFVFTFAFIFAFFILGFGLVLLLGAGGGSHCVGRAGHFGKRCFRCRARREVKTYAEQESVGTLNPNSVWMIAEESRRSGCMRCRDIE